VDQVGPESLSQAFSRDGNIDPIASQTLSPLIQYWHDKELPDHVAETLASFREHNPNLEQLVFNETSAEEFILSTHGAREAAAFRACAVPAMQADYFRYCAVHALGGIYADANFRCLRNLEWLIEGPEKGVFFGRQDPVPRGLATIYNWRHPVGPFRTVTNSMFSFRSRDHPLLELAVHAATSNIENRVAEGSVGVWVATGPGIFTSIYLLRELGSINAFIDYATDSVIEPSAALLCEMVGNYSRIARMWDGVGICPLWQRETFGVKTQKRLGGAHWARVKGSIYR
jgi:hypothetical protein